MKKMVLDVYKRQAPEVPTIYLKSAWTSALIAAAVLAAIVCGAFLF